MKNSTMAVTETDVNVVAEMVKLAIAMPISYGAGHAVGKEMVRFIEEDCTFKSEKTKEAVKTTIDRYEEMNKELKEKYNGLEYSIIETIKSIDETNKDIETINHNTTNILEQIQNQNAEIYILNNKLKYEENRTDLIAIRIDRLEKHTDLLMNRINIFNTLAILTTLMGLLSLVH